MKAVYIILVLLLMQYNISAQCPEMISSTGNRIKLVFDPVPNPIPSSFFCEGVEYIINQSGNSGNFFTVPNDFDMDVLDIEITLNYPGVENDCVYESGIFLEPTFPVELANFQASLENNDIYINWTTLSEEENTGFDIQQSYDGINFITIGGVNGAGFSDVQQDYNFIDKGVRIRALGSQSYYRLAKIDFDGSKTYSEVLAVDLGLDFEKFEITKITGWGASEPVLKVYYYAPETMRKINFVLTDFQGTSISRLSLYPDPGLNFIEIDLRGYANFFYFFALDNGQEVIGDKIAVGANFR